MTEKIRIRLILSNHKKDKQKSLDLHLIGIALRCMQLPAFPIIRLDINK